MNVCYDLKEQDGNDPQNLSKVVTGYETWCCSYDRKTKQASSQWKTPNSPKPKKARLVQSNVKIMLISFFDANGIVHKECSFWTNCELTILFGGVEKIMQ